MSTRGGVTTRGTSNGNSRGSAADRRRRRAWLVEAFGWPDVGVVLCWLCGVPLLQDEDPEAPGQAVTVDRIVLGADGGRYVRENIRPACGLCNSETGGRVGGQRAQARRPRTHGQGARTKSTHAPLTDSTMHGPVTAATPLGITAGQGHSRPEHDTHTGEHTRPAPPLYRGAGCA